MRFTINLATRTHLDHHLVNRIAYGAIALLLVVAGWNVSRVSSNAGEQSRLNADIAAIENRLGSKPGGVSEADVSRQRNHIRFYNGIIGRKSINWLEVLQAFESATPAGISLASLAPDEKQSGWKVVGHARSFKVVQLYLEKLESSASFSQVLLLSHQSVSVGEKDHGVQFTISCKVMN